MEIRRDKGRSPSYVCTIDPQSIEDLGILALVRKKVRARNKDLRKNGVRYVFYTDVMGRLGKNNPESWRYYLGNPKRREAIAAGRRDELCHPSRIRLEHARRADVYVGYRRV